RGGGPAGRLLDDLVVSHAAFPLPEEDVPADGKEPALGASSRRVLLPCAVGAQEGLLDEVFRVRLGPGEAQSEAVDRVEVRQGFGLEGGIPIHSGGDVGGGGGGGQGGARRRVRPVRGRGDAGREGAGRRGAASSPQSSHSSRISSNS